MNSNMDPPSVLKANEYSDPRKDFLVSISRLDAAATIIHLLFYYKIVVFICLPRWSKLLWHTQH